MMMMSNLKIATIILGHSVTGVQVDVSVAGPGQDSPPNPGGGLSHDLVRVCSPLTGPLPSVDVHVIEHSE